MFPKVHLLDFLEGEVGQNSIKKEQFPKILKDIEEKTGFSRLILTRGDGNCLVRSVLKYYQENLPNMLMEVVINLCSLANQDIILHSEIGWEVFEDTMCEIVRKLIVKMWDYKGVPEYHMDTNCIDGLAILIMMRLLGVETINIYQAFLNTDRNDGIKDSTDRASGWRQYKTDNSFQNHDPITVTVFSTDGKHYHSLV